MKLITLNVWGGHLRNPLLKFIHNNRHVDIFCFQELYYNAHRTIDDKERELSLNIFSDLKKLLPNHVAIFKAAVENVYGVGIFVNKELDLISEGEIIIHQKQHYPGIGENHDRNLQWVEVKTKTSSQIYSILNVHGLWNGKGKRDTPERIVQSNRIRQFMETINTPKVLCGDFNLRPDTESMKILERGMDNQITLNKIRSTRTRYYTKEEKYADYILTSPEIYVKQFSVMPDEVSDHAALFVDFL